MKSQARCYPELLEYCNTLPIVDCHDHSVQLGPKYADPIQVVIGEYLLTDMESAAPETDVRQLLNAEIPWEDRWPILETAWQRTCHTGFAQITRRVLKQFYDEDEVSLPALRRMQDRLLNLEDEAAFDNILDEANIVLRLEDVWPDVRQVLDGSLTLTPRGRLVIPLPAYHRVRSFMEVQELVAPLGRSVSSLDEYLNACREIFTGFKAYGAVAFKDQSAYARALDYGNPSRAEAEAVFNWFMADATRRASYPDGLKPLDDYLFHEFLRMARDLDLPVQLHTGHLAGLYGDITKANAVKLADLFLLHRDVRFDLFHANWPYGGEALFLVKSHPNVSLDFCWAHVIDPLYCQNLLRQALSSVPHSKIHGFGADFGGFGYPPGGGYPDRAWAQAQIAKENISIALADMVDAAYIDMNEAKTIARAWLFDNPNRFYRLGLSPPERSEKSPRMIISASRRTDIPAFYAEWFMEHVRAGFCTVPNPFNAHQVSMISLAAQDVDAIVFWTRNPRPLMVHLPELDARGYCYIFQYTLLDYPRWLETRTPSVDAAVSTFRELADRIGPERVIWRYDPLVFTRSLDTEYHRRKFAAIAVALAGSTRRVVVSVMDGYAKTRRRLGQLADEAPVAQEMLAEDAAFAELMRGLVDVAGAQGMQIQSCAETLDLQSYGIRPGKCIDDELLNRLFRLDIADTKDPSQRTQCGCVVSKDIGMYNSCLFGCQYCYATGSFDAARGRYALHDATAPSLFVTNSETAA